MDLLGGRYRLGPLIGSGGMAGVYEAEDTLLGRKVAVKLLLPQYAADDGFVERFEYEARATAGLTHPGIVGVYDVGEDAGRHFIVMELVEGRPLKEIIRGGPLSADRTVDVGVQVAKALEYAHQRGIVHRDVKPQNILVSADGGARLVDFGIAKASGAASNTNVGTVLGTVHYIAPEQARGEPAIPATDIYSLGAVLYEVATGRLPFTGDSALEIATKHVSAAPVPPSQVNPLVPIMLERAILHALEKDPARRPASGGDLARELLTYAPIEDEATRVVPTVGSRLGRAPAAHGKPARVKSNTWPLAMLALLAIGLIVGLFPLWVAVLQAGRV
ncbi:MAG: serine/threonine protein kinase with sensor(s) [Chloroflexi bacterium]|nr:serine/threonine protein kinase with sensor(s) [Chloroflexota bacterium]